MYTAPERSGKESVKFLQTRPYSSKNGFNVCWDIAAPVLYLGCFRSLIPSVDKDTHGFDGRKCVQAASKPLPRHQVSAACFSLPERISAPAKLLCTWRLWIFEWFLLFEPQMCPYPSRRKEQKAPERLAIRRVCSCQLMVKFKKKDDQ